MKRSIVWVFMHLLLIFIVIANLLTGLRIAAVHRPQLLSLSPLLPQGSLHDIHLLGGALLISVIISYLLYWFLFKKHVEQKSTIKQSRYHQVITWLGYFSLSAIALSGISIYFGILFGAIAHNVHFYAALIILLYIPLHAGVYFIQYGINALKLIFFPSGKFRKTSINYSIVIILASGGLLTFFNQQAPVALIVHAIELGQKISIDGQADEDFWQKIPEVKVHTFGGVNFNNGNTEVRIKAVENGIEAFFNISWDDPNKSLKHLPLVKTTDGWQVTQDGFYRFDEQSHYEDKFAVILSDNCAFGAAATAQLGPKPLADKPANWHGKGYHYTTDNSIVDLWHWKAVRTNRMLLMDDNYIAGPATARAGDRRYTAGYYADGKSSGAYVMNWKWYKQDKIVPKRLFNVTKDNDQYQNSASQEQQDKADWVMPWYDAKAYEVEDDTLPVGTIMPSVLYRSNRLEGDRANVRAFGRWHDGQWNLELSRKLNTKSKHDVALADNTCLWVAAFDRSQVAHTRHARPLQLNFSRGDN